MSWKDTITEDKSRSWRDTIAIEDSKAEGFPGEGYVRGALQSLPVAGGIAGGALGFASPIPGGTIVGTGLGSAAGKALENFGERLLGDNKTYDEAIIDPAKAAIEGAAAEMGGLAAAPIISKIAAPISRGAKDLAERFGARALGAERGTIKSMGLDKAKEAGRYALDNGLLSPLASTDDIVTRNEAVKRRAGEQMNDVYKAIDDVNASTFNPQDVASKVNTELGNFWRSPLNKAEASQFDNTLEAILARGNSPIPLQEAQALKQELGRAANWKNKLQITPKEQMARDAYGIVSSQIDEAVESGARQIGSDDLLETLSNAKKLYSGGKTADAFLENKVAREQGNKILGLTDWGLIGGSVPTAIMTGGTSVVPSALALGAKKGLEKYGAQNAALISDKLSKALNIAPDIAQSMRLNPAAIQTGLSSIAPEMSFIEQLPKAADNQPYQGMPLPPPPAPPTNIEKAKALNEQRKLQRQALGQ